MSEELTRRKRVNPAYSMRAFARDLDLLPSHLSSILKGNRGLSSDRSESVAKAMGLNDSEIESFTDLVDSSDHRSKKMRIGAVKRLEERLGQGFQRVDLDTFRIVSDWVCFALLELTKLKNFQPSVGWVSKKLGVDKSRIEEALESLIRTGLLRVSETAWVETEQDLATTSDIPSSAIKDFHISIMERAKDALLRRPVLERDVSNLVISISKEDLPEFKKRIRKFRADLNQWAETRPNRDSVYALSTQFFELTESEGEQ